MEDLSKYRSRIDAVDEKIVALFEERMKAAEAIGRIKAEAGLPVFDEKRERQVVAARRQQAKDENFAQEVEKLFDSILYISRKRQEKIVGTPVKKQEIPAGTKAVYMGIAGSYGEMAASTLFGKDAVVPIDNFKDVVLAVKEGKSEFGVLPIENSSTGAINQVYDLLSQYNLFITGELHIAARHCLLGIQGAKIEDIREVYSHEQGFFQCKEFLDQYPKWTQIPYFNTAVAARFVSEQMDKTKAAIADKRNAELYHLSVLAENINDRQNNKTRFIVISATEQEGAENNKCSVEFCLPNRCGALYEALRIFADRGLNLYKIESRPLGDKLGNYRFFVDFAGNKTDPKVADGLQKLKQLSSYLKYMGNYKANE